MFKNLPEINTDRLILRKMRLSDAQDVFEYASDPEVSRFVPWEAHKNIGDSTKFLEFMLKKYEKHEVSEWGLTLRDSGKFFGSIGFMFWDKQNSRSEIGCCMGRKYWGKGYAGEAFHEIISLGFEKMSLNRIESRCMADNQQSKSLMKKLGFSFEGFLRERLIYEGNYVDLEIHSLLKSEWNPTSSS